MNVLKIGIFDDHPVVSSGIKSYLENSDLEIRVKVCENSKVDLLKQLKIEEIDILIIDIVAPDVQGLDLFDEITNQYPKIKLIAYSTLKSPVLVENLLSIGVKGFVNKSQEILDLLNAIISVNKGFISVPEKYKFLTSNYHQKINSALTNREIEILHLIAIEKTTQEIADELFLSSKTIENHKQNLFKKMDVKNAAGLILTATRLGYIS